MLPDCPVHDAGNPTELWDDGGYFRLNPLGKITDSSLSNLAQMASQSRGSIVLY